MRRNLGLLGGFLALSAVFRTTPQEPPKSIPAEPVVQTVQADSGGPWNALCESSPNDSLPWDCAKTIPRITFLIATVPDPKATSLALFFDRSIESLIWAAADAGYSFERWWLPWKTTPNKDLLLLTDRKAQNKEQERSVAEPGLIVFRGTQPGQALLLFLVGETPTSGINKKAFGRALGYIDRISANTPTARNWVPVVGPTFSGSLAPLAEDVGKYLNLVGTSALHLHFISGTVSGAAAIEAFNERLDCFIKPNRDLVRFETTIEDDSEAIKEFGGYLAEKGKAPKKMALLMEDETEYGYHVPIAKPTTPEEQSLVVRYPRQIAGLRNAYEDTDAPVASTETPAPEGVKFTLKQSEEDEPPGITKDSVPDFSKQQGPISQHAALLSISSTLRSERVDYIGIIATDVLDSIFLSRFLRRSCPDARVFILDADLLFMREAEAAPLDGMLSVTTYPLFSRNQHWTKAQIQKSVGRRVHFTSRTAEGVYNAARALLQDPTSWKPDERDYLLDYSDPSGSHTHRPPLWITVLGSDGYWPVSLLYAEPTTAMFSSPAGPASDLHPEPPSRGWYILFWLILAVSIAHSVYVLYLLSLAPVSLARFNHGLPLQVRLAQERQFWVRKYLLERNLPRVRKTLQIARDSVLALRAVFTVYEDSSMQGRYGYKLPFLTSLTLVLACTLAMVTLALRPYWSVPYGSVTPLYDTWRFFYAAVAGCCWLVLVATCAALLWRSGEEFIESRRFADRRLITSFQEYWPVTTLSLTVAAASLGIFAILIVPDGHQSGFFFAYRSLMLTSGVSPLAPILLVSIAYFHWSWNQLRREDMISRRQYFKDFVKKIAVAPEMAMQKIDRVDGTLENIFSIHVWRPALLFIAAWFVVFQPWRTLKSVEPRLYDILFIFILATLYWMLSLCWSQFIWIWHDFRNLLEWLERDPIRNAFSRLRKEITWVPLVSSVREHQFLISSRSLDTLAGLRNFDPSNLEDAEKTIVDDLKRAIEGEIKAKTMKPFVSAQRLDEKSSAHAAEVDLEAYVELQADLDRLAVVVRDQLQAHQWQHGDSDSLIREHEGETIKSVTPGRRLLVLEEEFIAMRYLIYMRYIFRHLRNLLGFIVTGFILAAVSLQSYAFQSRHWIAFSSLCIFITLGVGVTMVFAEMDRDSILSRITDTKSNELGKTFVFRLLQFGTLPLITVLAAQFPFINRMFFSFVRPVLNSLH